MRVTLDLPPALVVGYERLAGEGVYLSRDEGLRHALVTAWRWGRASLLRLRVDFAGEDAEDEAAGGRTGSMAMDGDLGLAPSGDADRAE